MRHPQRFAEVADLARARAGFEVAQRSRWADAPSPDALTADRIGETLGEMTLYYSLADVALLGGSFAPLGGQEPDRQPPPAAARS